MTETEERLIRLEAELSYDSLRASDSERAEAPEP